MSYWVVLVMAQATRVQLDRLSGLSWQQLRYDLHIQFQIHRQPQTPAASPDTSLDVEL